MKTVHKNFFPVNIGQREQKELRELAASFGVSLRDFLSGAIRARKYEYQQRLALARRTRLNPQFVCSLTTAITNNN